MGWIRQIVANKSVFARRSFSSVIAKVAATAVAISVLVMLLSMSVLRGYKGLIKDKMAGFSGHIQVLNTATAINYEYDPFLISTADLKLISLQKGVVSAFPIAQKAGIAKSNSDLEGVILKGLFSSNDHVFYNGILKKGRMPKPNKNGRSNEIVISETLANKLMVKVGEKIKIFFFKETESRAMHPTIVGLYNTGVEEYDKVFALCSYRDLAANVIPAKDFKRSLNENMLAVTQIEVKVDDFSQLSEINEAINQNMPLHMRSETIKTLQSQVFDWLSYLDKNIHIILVLMGLVAGINMVTSILILIVDNTKLIGLLKSTGALNREIRTLFLSLGMQVVGLGLFMGNLLAVTFIFIQKQFKIFTLDEANYYTDFVPMAFSAFDFLWINGLTVFICLLAMLLPSAYVARISPVKALAFK